MILKETKQKHKQKIKGNNPCKDLYAYLIMKISAKKRKYVHYISHKCLSIDNIKIDLHIV